jgi:hypothetical protein
MRAMGIQQYLLNTKKRKEFIATLENARAAEKDRLTSKPANARAEASKSTTIGTVTSMRSTTAKAPRAPGAKGSVKAVT